MTTERFDFAHLESGNHKASLARHFELDDIATQELFQLQTF